MKYSKHQTTLDESNQKSLADLDLILFSNVTQFVVEMIGNNRMRDISLCIFVI